MKNILILFLLAVLPFSLMAQDPQLSSRNKKAIKEYYKGLDAYDAREYSDADDAFHNAIGFDPKFVEPYLMLGQIYQGQRNYEKAIEYFERGIAADPKFFPPTYYNVARLQQKVGRYEDAKKNIEAYLGFRNIDMGSKMQAERDLKLCDFAIDQIKNPKPFDPKPLGKGVNTEYSEYMPYLTADESTIIFTRFLPATGNNYGPELQEDFYISRFVNGQWTEAKPLSNKINSPLNEGSHSISPDGKILYFTACNRESGKGSCDIYMSELSHGSWDYPVNVYELNTGSWDSQPCISSDGKTIYFTSTRIDKNYDLYMTVYDEVAKQWSEPKRLPDNINTSGVEQTPFIHPDGKTLYFTSNGLVGMGGQDIFYTRRLTDSTWSDPVNIGYPINTNNDEACLFVSTSGETAYFAKGTLDAINTIAENLDIYSFSLYEEARPGAVTYMKGVVTDAVNETPLVATFELTDLKSGKVVAASSSDEDGSFLLCIPTGCDYMLNVSREKYVFYSDNFNLSGTHSKTDPFVKNVALQPISNIGGIMVLNNIFFDTDKFDLKPESFIELQKLYGFLTSNPSMKIEIGGHTDNTGTKEHNKTLSENRARAVVNYLTGKGIAANRMTYKGYGDTIPVATNETPEGRALNRRTELKIISY